MFGAIRWDAWNGRSGDVISTTVAKVMAPTKYRWRLPWFVNTTDPATISFDGNRQAIMDDELRYASRAGLRFFAYDTYCVWPTDADIPQCAGYWGIDRAVTPPQGPSSNGYKPTDPAYGLKLHLSSPVKHLMNVSLVLLGGAPAVPRMRARSLRVMRDPAYQRVLGGRPLVFLFQASQREADMNGGWAAWKAQWDAFRAESVSQGTGNPYFVALCVGTGNFGAAVALKENLGFDAIGAYALPGGTLAGVPFAEQIGTAREFWSMAARNGSAQTLVPPVPTGWDPRPRADHPPVWVHESGAHFVEPTAAEITGIFADAAAFMRAQPAVAEAGVALAYAWNENTEGGWILPTKGNGTMRLDAVAKALLGG